MKESDRTRHEKTQTWPARHFTMAQPVSQAGELLRQVANHLESLTELEILAIVGSTSVEDDEEHLVLTVVLTDREVSD